MPPPGCRDIGVPRSHKSAQNQNRAETGYPLLTTGAQSALGSRLQQHTKTHPREESSSFTETCINFSWVSRFHAFRITQYSQTCFRKASQMDLIRSRQFEPFSLKAIPHRRPFSHKALVNPLMGDWWWRRSFVGVELLQHKFWADSRYDP